MQTSSLMPFRTVPGEPGAQIMRNCMVAIITVRDREPVRDTALPAADAITIFPSDSANLPFDTALRLYWRPTSSALPPLMS